MKFLKFFISKAFFKNLAIAVGIGAFLIFLTFQFLNIYTYHGKYVQVPDLEGYNETQLKSVLEAQNLRYTIIDSVYSKRHIPGTVVEQQPKKGAKVKKNRKLFIIMNAQVPEMIIMPELKDVSIRQAKNILSSAGLKTGEIIYVHSPYKNVVLDQYFDNIPIAPGTKIMKNSVIDLEVGKGLGNSMAVVPDLTGMSLNSVRSTLSSVALNLGVIVEDHTSKDHEDSAFVWKQRPSVENGPVRLGTSIDIWTTLDSTLLLPDTTLTDELVVPN